MNISTKESIQPRKFGFLLLEKFTLVSFSSAIEPLRLANHSLEKNVFNWRTFSEAGESVLSSDGVSINVDYPINSEAALRDIDLLIVCGSLRYALEWINIKQAFSDCYSVLPVYHHKSKGTK